MSETNTTITEEKLIHTLTALNRASQLISSRINLDDVLRELLSIGMELTLAQHGSFELYSNQTHTLAISALAGNKMKADEAPPLPVDETSVVGWVAFHRQSLRIDDLHQLPWQAMYQPLPVAQTMRSELAVPLVGVGGRLEGVLNLESPAPGAFSSQDQTVLEALATQAVIALQENRLLDAMQELQQVLLTADENELLQLIINRACDLINVSVGTIWTIAGKNRLVLRQSTSPRHHHKELPLDNSLTGQAIRLARPLIIDDVRTHPHFLHPELAAAQNWVSAIIVPLLMPGQRRAVGGFSLYSAQRRNFSDWDKKLLTYLANHAAIAIENTREVAQLKQPLNLTDREQEVLDLLIAGCTNKEIAQALTVSVNTAKKHVQNVFTKLNVDNRAAAVAKAMTASK